MEWGTTEVYFGEGTLGDWQEYNADAVREFIIQKAGNPDVTPAKNASAEGRRVFSKAEAQYLSIMEVANSGRTDGFLTKLMDDSKRVRPITADEYIEHLRPKGQLVSRDSEAVLQGIHIPPHIGVLAEVAAMRSAPHACKELVASIEKAVSHLERRDRDRRRIARIGTNVFIGHGRSSLWRELKDFIQDRLQLPWDEFNRVPVAGITNIARLSEMLDAAAVAFVIMTAEDEQIDGKMQARMNVIHEVGLFQGRLGFTKGIVLIEDGCEEFSNIEGLGQIRFPKGNIRAAFEEIRRVLEREALLASSDREN